MTTRRYYFDTLRFNFAANVKPMLQVGICSRQAWDANYVRRERAALVKKMAGFPFADDAIRSFDGNRRQDMRVISAIYERRRAA